jgi:hypothetical protein
MTAWPRWRKNELLAAIEALIEAQLVVENVSSISSDRAFKRRFAAAMKLFANC